MTDQSQPPQGPNVIELIGEMTVDAWLMRKQLTFAHQEIARLRADEKQLEIKEKTDSNLSATKSTSKA